MQIIDATLNKPLRLIGATVVVFAVAVCVLVSLPYSNLPSHGSFSHLHVEDPLVLKGKDVYVQEGCHYCHTNNMRPVVQDVNRFSNPENYGNFPLVHLMEYRFESPAALGSRRIGPDLSRLADRYDADSMHAFLTGQGESDLAQAYHRYNRIFSDAQRMGHADGIALSWKIRAMSNGGAPLTDAFQKAAFIRTEGMSRGEALVAFLLSRGEKQHQFQGSFYR